MNLRAGLAMLAFVVGCAGDCWAWGATGHEIVSGVAIEKLAGHEDEEWRRSIHPFALSQCAAAELLAGGDLGALQIQVA